MEAGFPACGMLDPQKLSFHEEIRKICESGCRSYGKTWACPPAVGTVDECRERVRSYGKMLLFSRAYLLEDSLDMAGAGRAMTDFRIRARELGRRLRDPSIEVSAGVSGGASIGDFRILSNESCDVCGKCAYPNAPCRRPDQMHHSIEGYGFVVSDLAKEAGIPYMNGKNTVTFFGAVLYGK